MVDMVEKITISKFKYGDLDKEKIKYINDLETKVKKYQELTEHYELIGENTLDIIFQTTKTGKILYINQATEKIAGYKPEEMVGNNFIKFVPKKEIPKYLKIIQNTLKGLDIGSFESHVIHKNGQLIPVEFAGKLVHKSNSKMILGTIKDITERKKAEDELINARNELEENVKKRTAELSKTNAILKAEIKERKKTENELKKAHLSLRILNQDLEKKVKSRTIQIQNLLQQKDEFINQLGHDLKNPLNPLINLLPIIAEEVKDPEIKEMLDVTMINVDYMNNLVVNTIELARLNSAKTEFSIENIQLFKEIENSIEKNRLLLMENEISIKNNIETNIFVLADELRLAELVDNLIYNATKFTPKNGKIIIDAKTKRKFIEISIKDNGIGMSQKQINHIFEEFYKIDESRHDMSSVGLGLSICKRIVEKHGGKIWAESEGINKGSIIYFTLPKE